MEIQVLTYRVDGQERRVAYLVVGDEIYFSFLEKAKKGIAQQRRGEKAIKAICQRVGIELEAFPYLAWSASRLAEFYEIASGTSYEGLSGLSIDKLKIANVYGASIQCIGREREPEGRLPTEAVGTFQRFLANQAASQHHH